MFIEVVKVLVADFALSPGALVGLTPVPLSNVLRFEHFFTNVTRCGPGMDVHMILVRVKTRLGLKRLLSLGTRPRRGIIRMAFKAKFSHKYDTCNPWFVRRCAPVSHAGKDFP